MQRAYPREVDTSHVTAECAQAAANFFTKNQRFPTQEEGDAMLAEIKRAHVKDYKIGNLTKAQLGRCATRCAPRRRVPSAPRTSRRTSPQ